MDEYNKLEVLINKYLNECINKNIKIISDDNEDILVKTIMQKNKNAKLFNKSEIDESCVIVLIHPKHNDELIELINDNIDKNVIFLAVVPLSFDFDNIIKSVKGNSIDADYWRKDGKKYKNYIVTIKHD